MGFHACPSQCRIAVFVGPSPLPLVPAAHAFRALMLITLARSGLPPAVGLCTTRQDRPFHRSMRLVPGPHPQLIVPTAHAAFPGPIATLLRKSERPWGVRLGLGSRDQTRPFQCRISVRYLGVDPTAQAFEGELAATPPSSPAGPGI
jgi:hypothetical protein